MAPTTLTRVFPDAPAPAAQVAAALEAAGFIYSAPDDAASRRASWPTGFLLDWHEDAPGVVYVGHWDDAFMPWHRTTAAQRAAYHAALAAYRTALEGAGLSVRDATN